MYLTDDSRAAALLLDKAIAGCSSDAVEEIRSLGNTLSSWRTEILAHHATGASNGPTEGLKPLRKAGQALWARLQALRALPAASAPPRRRRHLAKPSPRTAHPNALSPVERVGPVLRRGIMIVVRRSQCRSRPGRCRTGPRRRTTPRCARLTVEGRRRCWVAVTVAAAEPSQPPNQRTQPGDVSLRRWPRRPSAHRCPPPSAARPVTLRWGGSKRGETARRRPRLESTSRPT